MGRSHWMYPAQPQMTQCTGNKPVYKPSKCPRYGRRPVWQPAGEALFEPILWPDTGDVTLHSGNDPGTLRGMGPSRPCSPQILSASDRCHPSHIYKAHPDLRVPTSVLRACSDTAVNEAYACPQVRVCIVDTGVDWQHPDLIGNLWMNEKEMNGPGATAANGYQNGN